MTYTLRHNHKYEILTPNGFESFGGVRKLSKDKVYAIRLSSGNVLHASEDHPFIDNAGSVVHAHDLVVGLQLQNDVSVVAIELVDTTDLLYDVVGVGSGLFNVDGIVSHNCDFITSGESVIAGTILEWYQNTHVREPVEKRGFDGNYWIFEYPSPSKSYIISADVARGDGSDYSAFHVLDVENLRQVAEYKGKLESKDFGNMLYQVGFEWNDALVVVENAQVGWNSLQTLIDRNYPNLFYSSADLKYVDVQRQYNNKINAQERKLTPGFTTTSKTRPLMISKMEEYFRNQDVVVHSKRLIDELFVFHWQGSKPQALRGYNDDLVMSFAIGMWVRDTALRLRTQGIELTRSALDSMTYKAETYTPVFVKTDRDRAKDQWTQPVNGIMEDLSWLVK